MMRPSKRLTLAMILVPSLIAARVTRGYRAASHTDRATTRQSSPPVTWSAMQTSPAIAQQDTTGLNLVPPGYGTLRQDDIAVKTQLPSTLVRVVPLDETVIRLLSSDSYRALRDLQEGKRQQIASLADRHNVRRPSLWYVSYYGLQPPDSRYNPNDIVIQSAGRDFRPLEIIPLTAGFRDQRVRPRETQSAIYLYEDGINVNQSLTITIEGVQNTSWDATLRTIERERSLVRSRVKQ